MKTGRQLGTLRSRIVIAVVAASTLITGAAVVVPQLAKATGEFKANVNPDPPFTGNNAFVTEGNFGTTPVNVRFELTDDHPNQVTVHYNTGVEGDTATENVDYVGQDNGAVVFAAHEMSKDVVFNVKNDTTDEPDEVFTVHITSVDNVTGTGAATFTAGHDGTVTIQDNDAPPAISLPDTEATEGTGGTTKMTFTLTLSSAAGEDRTYYVFTGVPTRDNDPDTAGPQVNNPASDVTDYTPLSGEPVTMKAGFKTATFTVDITTDTRDEADEWLAANVKAENNESKPTVAYGEGRIADDDPAARLDVLDPPSHAEGPPCGGLNQPACSDTIDFTVSLTPASEKRIVLNYTTEDRTAKAGEDYTTKSGSGDPATPPPNNGTGLVFNPGDTTKTISVTIKGDGTQEPDEYFVLHLLSATNATIGDGQATGLITNDDGGTFATVDVSNGGAAKEFSAGVPGKATFTINVHRTGPTDFSNFDVFYQTADGPENGNGAAATAASDYVAQPNGKVTINYPDTSAPVTVNFKNDNVNEPDEYFQLQLLGATNAAITDGVGQATIQDDDPAPTLSIADNSVAEGSSSTPADGTLDVTLSAPSGQTVTVHVSTPNPNSGTATPGDDYKDVPDQTIEFAPGDTSEPFTIKVVGDTLDENDETVFAQLNNASGAGINDGSGTLTITDDDNPPTINIGNYTVTEGSAGNTTAKFPVQLSAASSKPITVHVATDNGSGTATAGSDYTATSADLTFNPGASTKQEFSVPVIADSVDEANETFTATLSSPNANATLGASKTGTATIVDDDDGPSLAINDVTVTEGNTGTTTNAAFTVTKTGTTTQTVGVHFATADGTATQPADYTANSGDLSFAPNETTKTIVVPVKGDNADEPNEGFTVNLSAPTNGATISDATGNGTITDDDPTPGGPKVGVGTATATEGDPATFTFTSSAAAPEGGITVNYSTADGTAKAASDYTAATNQTATIPAGQTTKTVDIATTEDTTHETQETFTLTINSATGADVDPAFKTGTGTINDDDAAVTKPQITTGAGAGGGPHIQSFEQYNSNPPAVASFMDGAESTGKRVARGDVDGDGIDEIITGSGPGSSAVVSVYSSTGQLKASSFAYAGGRFYGGVFVAAGDVDGDGKDEVITGAGPGGGPHVIVWKVTAPTLTPVDGGFMAYGSFAGGVTVAAGDVNGDGKADIITGPGAGGGPDVELWNGASTHPRITGFMAYTDPQAQPNWTGGINVAAGDLDGDGKAEIAVGPWPGGGPHLRTFNHDGTLRNGGVFVFTPDFNGGITVAVGDLDGDGHAEIVVGPMTKGNRVRAFTADLVRFTNEDFQPYEGFQGGNSVAIGRA